MRRGAQFLAAPLALSVSASVLFAETPDFSGELAYGAYLASECMTCHQADGTAVGIPAITHLQHAEFISAMQDYQTHRRPHPVMQMIAASLTEADLAALAAYFTSLD